MTAGLATAALPIMTQGSLPSAAIGMSPPSDATMGEGFGAHLARAIGADAIVKSPDSRSAQNLSEAKAIAAQVPDAQAVETLIEPSVRHSGLDLSDAFLARPDVNVAKEDPAGLILPSSGTDAATGALTQAATLLALQVQAEAQVRLSSNAITLPPASDDLTQTAHTSDARTPGQSGPRLPGQGVFSRHLKAGVGTAQPILASRQDLTADPGVSGHDLAVPPPPQAENGFQPPPGLPHTADKPLTKVEAFATDNPRTTAPAQTEPDDSAQAGLAQAQQMGSALEKLSARDTVSRQASAPTPDARPISRSGMAPASGLRQASPEDSPAKLAPPAKPSRHDRPEQGSTAKSDLPIPSVLPTSSVSRAPATSIRGAEAPSGTVGLQGPRTEMMEVAEAQPDLAAQAQAQDTQGQLEPARFSLPLQDLTEVVRDRPVRSDEGQSATVIGAGAPVVPQAQDARAKDAQVQLESARFSPPLQDLTEVVLDRPVRSDEGQSATVVNAGITEAAMAAQTPGRPAATLTDPKPVKTDMASLSVPVTGSQVQHASTSGKSGGAGSDGDRTEGGSDTASSLAGLDGVTGDTLATAGDRPVTDLQQPLVSAPVHVAPQTLQTAAAALTSSLRTVTHLAAQIVGKFDAGTTRFDVELHPLDLGRVDVRLEVGSDGQITAAMSFDNPQAASEMRARSADLHKALETAGFNLSGGISFDVAGDRGQGGSRNSSSEPGFAQRSRALELATSAAADLADAAAASTRISAYGTRPARGVDIRI